jgi:hypothetical protein
MTKFNGLVQRKDMVAGSQTDMTIAYVFRVFTVIIQGVVVLGLWALINLAVTIRDDTRDIKKEWPEMKKDIGELKEQGKTFATKKQLEDAETRVKNEIAEQLKQGTITTKR